MSDFEMSQLDKDRLEYTQTVRRTMLDKLTKDNTVLPSGKDEFEALTKLLDGMDNNIVRTAKLRQEAQKNKSDGELRAAIAQYLNNPNSFKHQQVASNTPKVVDRSLDIGEMVPDETREGVISDVVREEIVGRMKEMDEEDAR